MERSVVVAGVVVDADRVLIAQRRRPVFVEGKWEFPGGKVEPGESEPDALVRELMEELDIACTVFERVPGEWDLSMGAVLHVYLAHIEAGAPTAGHDHMSVRWVTPEEFATIDWLDSDREALPAVVRALAQTP